MKMPSSEICSASIIYETTTNTFCASKNINGKREENVCYSCGMSPISVFAESASLRSFVVIAYSHRLGTNLTSL